MKRKPKTDSDNSKNWQPKLANFISFFALIISGILAYYTYQVFHLANSQSESVIKSANAAVDASKTARNTLKETKDYNKAYLKIQKDIFDSNNEADKERNNKITASLDIQIKALHESQKQFEMNNQALLQVSNFDTLKLKEKNPVFQFMVSNLGNQPAKLNKMFVALIINSPNTDSIIVKAITKLEKNPIKYLTDDLYIMKESPQIRTAVVNAYLNNPQYNSLITGQNDLYVFGNCLYTNLVTKKKKLYRFCVEMAFKSPIYNRTIYNETIDL